MNFKAGILTLFILFSFVGLNSLGRFYMTEPARAGGQFELYASVRNPSHGDLDDVSMKLQIYDLGIRLKSDEFDINDGRHKLAYINWFVPSNIRKGTYLAKISVSNQDYHDWKHVYVTII